MVTLGDVFVALRADPKGLRNDLEDARQKTTSWAQNLGGKVTGFLGGAVAAGATAAAAAVVGIGASAFSAASQFDEANKRMTTQLGLSDDLAKAYGDTVKNIYGNNFGDDIKDVAESVSEVDRAFARIDYAGIEEAGDDLQKVTESAIALRDAFGIEVAESASAAVELMDKFGLTSEQAFDFLATGMQRGLDGSGDFLDSIGEYSTQFANGGATAEQFFSILQTGLQGGMLGTDKAADAFKEFRVRIGDGSTATADGLKMLGINAEAFTAKLANGTMSTADAFQVVLDSLREIEDPTLRMQAGVALIGTQFEDLGDSAVANLSMTATSLDEMTGAIGTLNRQYETLPTFFEGLRRRALVAIAPIGEALLGVANTAAPYIEEAFGRAETAVKDFIANSNFEWSPEFKQIKLGDLFDFVQEGEITKIEIGDWFTFTGFGDAKQIAIGDLFEFTSDSTGTEINLADYVTISYDSEGALIDVSKLLGLGEGGTFDLSSFFSFGSTFALSDIFAFIPESGTYDIAGIFVFDPASVGTVSLGELFPFLGENTEFKLSDILTIGSDYPVFSLSDLFPFLGDTGTYDVGGAITLDKASVGSFSLSDFFTFIPEAGTYDIGGIFSFDPSSIGTVSLSDLFPFLSDETTVLNIFDSFSFDTSSVGTVSLKELFPFLPGGESEKLEVFSLFSFDPASIGTVAITDLFPFLGEGGTFDLSSLFTSGEGEGGGPQWVADLMAWEMPEFKNATLDSLMAFTWPDIKEATSSTLTSLFAWVWPDAPADISSILDWDWPDAPSAIENILTWVWPEFSETLTGIIDRVVAFKWPELKKPDWIASLLNFTIPTPAWVTALLNWRPTFPNLFGGGDDEDEVVNSGEGFARGKGKLNLPSTGTGKTINVNFYNTTINNETDIEALAYRVGHRIAYAT